MSGPVTRELPRTGRLSDLERHVLEDTSLAVRDFKSGQSLTREADLLAHCPLLLSGFACCYKLLEDGRRQIIALHLPTELCNLPTLLLGHLAHGIGTLTSARVAFVPHATILAWMGHHPDRMKALWRATLVDAAISQEWVVNTGRRTAYQRTAHLLCEFLTRMRWAGLAEGLTCSMPFTPWELADALALTGIHVSRALEWLCDENLAEVRDETLTVLNWSGLASLAGFDPTYLHHVGAAN